jgi:hypothetical protein
MRFNNEVSAPQRDGGQDLAATYERSEKLRCSAAGEFGLWRIGGAVLRRSNQIGFDRKETLQAKDEVAYLPDGNSRADVQPMAISVDGWGKIAAPSHALANRHSWP